jgi:hypothetical protein
MFHSLYYKIINFKRMMAFYKQNNILETVITLTIFETWSF